MRRVRRVAVAMTIATLCAAAPRAWGEGTNQACVRAYESAQLLRNKGELTAARDALRFCARSECPAVASADCLEWLGEVERAMPSVVIGAHLGDRDVTDVVVSLDGKELTVRLDGKPIDLDPGEHTFTFTMQGQEPIEQTLVIKSGEKNRPLDVHFKPPAESRASASTQAAPPAPVTGPAIVSPPSDAGSGRRTAGFVVGGVGVVALGVGIVFGLRAIAKNHDSNAVCPARDCASQAALDANADARSAANVANVAVALGIAGLGVGTFLVLTGQPSRATGGVRVSPYAAREQSGLLLSGAW